MGGDKPSGFSGDKHLRILLDTLTQGVQQNDCDGVIVYSNRAHHRILGYELGELLGRKIWDLLPTESDKESLKTYFTSLKQNQPAPVPYISKSRRKNGTLVDVQVDWNYLRDDDGSLAGFISVISDISKQKRSEEDLRQHAQGLDALLGASKSFAATLELPKILQASVDSVSRLVGLDTSAIYLIEGKKLRLWATTPPLPPQFPDELRISTLAEHPRIGEAVRTGKPVFLPDTRGAVLTPAEQSVVEQRNLRTLLYLPLIADTEVVGALIVGSVGTPSTVSDEKIDLSRTLANLSALAVKNAYLYNEGLRYSAQLEQSLAEIKLAKEEREKLQDQLAQAQKLESIGQLAGGLAHDFNNMLGVIIGHTELDLLGMNHSDPLYASLQEIQKAAKRSSDLTSQLLAFARRQTIEPRVLDMNAAVENLYKMLRRLISESIDLEWIPADDVWQVSMDPVQIDQILVNLCVNARDSIEGKGRIRIEASNEMFDEAACTNRPGFYPGEYAVLAVSDTGCGMDRETMDKVFEPFFTTKTMGHGTGMGLATVYGIVKQNGGFINVYSEPGKGTTFRIYLPRYKGDRKEEDWRRQTEGIERGWETVLLVEDEPSLLEVGVKILEMLGYTVIAATSPEEAIGFARSGDDEIHLLMTDVIMPGMNGRELAREITSLHPRIKCLFMSGYTSNVVGHHGVLDEGVQFIQKPFSVQSLSEKIHQVMEQKGPAATPSKHTS